MITDSQIEEFHRLGKISVSKITDEQHQRFKELWEMAYGKPDSLTDDELKKRIETKPFDKSAVEECLPKISRMTLDAGTHSFSVIDTDGYPKKVHRIWINKFSKDNIGSEIVHEFCHIYYDVDSAFTYQPRMREEILDNYAKLSLEKDPGLLQYILTRLKESNKLVS